MMLIKKPKILFAMQGMNIMLYIFRHVIYILDLNIICMHGVCTKNDSETKN